MKKILILVAAVILALVYLVWQSGSANAPANSTSKNQVADTNKSEKPSESKPSFNKHKYSLNDPTSIWVIVNKTHPLQPKDYIPSDLVVPDVPLRVPGNSSMQLRQVTAQAMETMFSAATKDGINLMLSSGYRSYSYQVSLYGSYVKQEGQAAADTFSARPGYSEHQTGLAADITTPSHKCELEACFGQTTAGKWLVESAYKYGFILRYPKGLDNITGYEYEPWHFRYVGTYLSEQMHKTGAQTLEKFFGVSGGETY